MMDTFDWMTLANSPDSTAVDLDSVTVLAKAGGKITSPQGWAILRRVAWHLLPAIFNAEPPAQYQTSDAAFEIAEREWEERRAELGLDDAEETDEVPPGTRLLSHQHPEREAESDYSAVIECEYCSAEMSESDWVDHRCYGTEGERRDAERLEDEYR